jgi:hypothetical protein
LSGDISDVLSKNKKQSPPVYRVSDAASLQSMAIVPVSKITSAVSAAPRLPELDFSRFENLKSKIFTPTARILPIMDTDKRLPKRWSDLAATTQDSVGPRHVPIFWDLSSLPEPVLPSSNKNAHDLAFRDKSRPRRHSRFFPRPSAPQHGVQASIVHGSPLEETQTGQTSENLDEESRQVHQQNLYPAPNKVSTNTEREHENELQTTINMWRILSIEARRVKGGEAMLDTKAASQPHLVSENGRRDVSSQREATESVGLDARGLPCIHANSLTGFANNAAAPSGSLIDSAICMNSPMSWYQSANRMSVDLEPAKIPLPDDSWTGSPSEQQSVDIGVRVQIPIRANATVDDV